MRNGFVSGALAGAAGTTALNAVTYADMALRGRAASEVPEQVVEHTGAPLGEGERAANRRQGLGSLLGFAVGVGVGAGYGLVGPPRAGSGVPAAVGLAVAASLAGNAPAAALGLTKPLSWSAADWLSDMVPHLVYGAVTAATFEMFNRDRHR